MSREGIGVEVEADWRYLQTPETYLGSWRSVHFASAGRLRFNQWTFSGRWTIGPESVALDQAGGTIALRYHARDAHLVLSRGAREPIPFRGASRRRSSGPCHAGSTWTKTETDCSGGGRLHQLVREYDAVRDRTVEITFLEPGAEAYVFTFG